MKRIIISLLGVFLLSGTAFAKNLVIGTVNTGKIAPFLRQMQMTEVNKMKARFETPEIKAIQKKLSARRAKLNDSSKPVDAQQKESLQKSIKVLTTELRSKMSGMRDEMTKSGQSMQGKLIARFRQVIKTVADKHKVDVVFPDNALLYSNNTVDITDDVVVELKKLTQS